MKINKKKIVIKVVIFALQEINKKKKSLNYIMLMTYGIYDLQWIHDYKDFLWSKFFDLSRLVRVWKKWEIWNPKIRNSQIYFFYSCAMTIYY